MPQVTTNAGRPRRWRLAALPWLLLAGVVVWNGADRVATDATTPVVWHGATPAETARETLRIATFNIHGGRGGDGRLDLGRTAQQLGEVDLVWLQEVHAGGWSSRDQADELGRELGLAAAFLPTERWWWRDHFGNAWLTRQPLELVQRCPLRNTRGKAFRQAVLAEVQLQGQPVRVLGVHVDRQTDRTPQLAIVTRMFLALEPPSILVGDLNTSADDPALRPLLEAPGVVDPLQGVTTASGHIDWLLYRGLDCEAIEYVTGPASDHPAVRAEFRWPRAPAP